MKKVVTVVGARPQFIKAAVVSHELRKRNNEILVHTGQHFDYNMSQQFFDELEIPNPDYNLGISSGSHGQMTGKMIIGIEDILIKEAPDFVLIYGDTNSTLAAALAAAKLHISICHVEAGCRTHNMNNPEEINRVCTDHLSEMLMMSSESAKVELEREGLMRKATFVGDPMYDAFVKYSKKRDIREIKLNTLNGKIVSVPNQYYYLTCHREENTKDDKPLYEIFKAMEQLDAPTIYPVHPRNKERAKRLYDNYGFRNLILTEPVGYLESVCLVKNCIKVVTDSGGLQREAFFAKKKCVTVFDYVTWPETMIDGRNTLSTANSYEILENLKHEQRIDDSYKPFGDGKAYKTIVKLLEEYQT